MNREIYPGGLYPLTGDVVSQVGVVTATVTGIQHIAVSNAALVGGEEFMFDPNVNKWVPQIHAVIQVNGLTVSNDPYISVNVTKPVLTDGV